MKKATPYIVAIGVIGTVIFGYLQYKAIKDNLEQANKKIDETTSKLDPLLGTIGGIF